MLSLTKIFHFEAAHAIYGYNGACARLHGHSYELHVSVGAKSDIQNYIEDTGMIIDLRILKKLVQGALLSELDHKTILSGKYISTTNSHIAPEDLVIFPAEPTVENMLLYIKRKLEEVLPQNIQLISLKLYETKDSLAEWKKGW